MNTRALHLAALILAATALSGCAQAEQPLTLRDTKSQVQLLRNGAAARIPADAIAAVGINDDTPVACGEGDPHLAWASSVRLELTADDPIAASEVHSLLVDSFVEDGWVSSRPGDAGTSLVSSAAFSKITVELQDENTAPALLITVEGPCVLTAGLDSAEVRRLVGIE